MRDLIRTDTPSTSPSLSRRQPLLQRRLSTSPAKGTCGGSTAGEVCGGTTAECAAVCCCCPCSLVNLLVLVIYKVPAGLCRRALRHRRRKRLIQRRSRSHCRCCCGDSDFEIHPLGSGDASEDEDDFLELKIIGKEDEEDEAVAALEKEMWNRFYGAGFWRSPSQRGPVSSPRTAKMGLSRCPSQKESAATVVPSPRVSLMRDVASPRIVQQ